MSRTRQRLALDITETAVALVDCSQIQDDDENSKCFYQAYDSLVRLVGQWKALPLGDISHEDGAFSANGTAASIAAAFRNVKRGSLRWQCADYIYAAQGATIKELIRHTGRPHQSVSSAVNTLMNNGWVRAGEETRDRQTVWRITPDAAKELTK